MADNIPVVDENITLTTLNEYQKQNKGIIYIKIQNYKNIMMN